MKVRFLQRDLLTECPLPAGMSVTVRERANHVYGGPKSCLLEVSGNEKAMPELTDWIRNRIEIYDDKGLPLWWGIVERVEVPVGKVKLVADVNEMANAIKVIYTLTNSNGQSTGYQAETQWIEDADSIQKYGRKELLIPIGESNAVAAEVQARIELKERAYPRIYPERGGSQKEAVATIQGMGEWETLGWQYAKVPTRLALSYQTVGNGGGFDLQSPEVKVAQSFLAATDFRLGEVGLYLRKTGSPGEVTVEVHEWIDEQTPGESLGSARIHPEQIGAGFGWVSAFFEDELALSAGERYFLMISCQWCDLSNFYRIALDPNKGYPGGSFRINVTAGWMAHSADMPFRLNRNVQFAGHSTVSDFWRKIDNLTSGFAQSFTISSGKTIAEAGIYLRRVGDPGQLSITLCKSASGNIGDQISTATIEAIDVSTELGWKRALFDEALAQPAGEYWLVLSAKQADAINYYEFKMDGSQSYSGGSAKQKTVSLFVDGNGDMPFKTWQSKLAASYTTMTGSTLSLGGAVKGLAQSFRLSSSCNLSRARIYLKKVGNPGDLSVAIGAQAEGGGPGDGNLGSATIETLDVSTNWAWYTVEFNSFPVLAAFKPYYLQFSAEGDANNYYLFQVDGNGAFPGESAWSKDESDWQVLTSDIPFLVWGSEPGTSWAGPVNSTRKVGGEYETVAQQIRIGKTAELLKVQLQARKTGEPGDLSIGLYADAGGWPGALLGSCTIDRRRIGSTLTWWGEWLDKQADVQAGGLYWIKASSNNADESNFFEIGVDNGAGYSQGVLKLEQAGDWTSLAADIPFQVFEPSVAHSFGTIGSVEARLGAAWPMMAMKVKPTAAMALTSLGLYLAKVGQPDSLEVNVARDSGGFPGEVMGTAKLSGEQVGTSPGWRIAAMEEPVNLEANSAYWLVLSASGASAISYFKFLLDGNGGYAPGSLIYKMGEAWAEGAGDMPFRMFANDMVETSQLLQNFLTAYGQFFRAVFVEPSSGILMESYRAGTVDALTEVENLLEIGTMDYVRMLARVNFDRSVEIRTQPVEQLTAACEMKADGELYLRSGARVGVEFDPVGRWMSIEDLLRGARFANVVTGSQQIFIEAAKWDKDGKVETTAANWENPYARKVKLTDG